MKELVMSTASTATRRQGTFPCGRLALALAFALAVATARAGSSPQKSLDECTGGEGVIHVKGWTYDPDVSSQSIDVHVYLYADSACTIRYGDIRVLTANVSRPDVNQAKGITGDHGFDADIPVSNAGDYWVKVFAIDATGDADLQIGTTRGVTVTAAGSATGSTVAPTIIVVEPTNTVTVTRFHQSYPYSGKATVEYAIGGTLPSNAVAVIVLCTDNASATFVQSNIVAGANSHVIDFASSFGGALLLTDAWFSVSVTGYSGGVQLWENGPYWAECNVGAATPEEYGHHFWWGDTVGYTNTGSAWISVKDGTSISFSNSGTAASTHGKDIATLLTEGWIDSTGNLVAAHDAATAHLGSPWRLPTSAEFSTLIGWCNTTWITNNGVSGRLVTGKGDYADRNIFLPAVGFGYGADFLEAGSIGGYWSSSVRSDWAWFLFFVSNRIVRDYTANFTGMSVRPVRDFSLCGADGAVTYDPPPETSSTVKVTKFHQSHPYSGKATVEYTVGGRLPANAVAEIVLNTDGASATFVRSNVVAGANSHVIDFASSFGGALLLTNASFVVTISEAGQGGPGGDLGGVQLWENGPYWAKRNVGATKPGEYGLYFWWGDTVGYKRENDSWVAADGSTSGFEFSSGDGAPSGMDNSALQSAGWIDSTGNLAAAHDAATVHLGAPWRMPTDAEFAALLDNCTSTWTTLNGFYGRLVTGKGDYADRSIFLPASGFGEHEDLSYFGSSVLYWSSTPRSDNLWSAWSLGFDSDFIDRINNLSRYYGLPVRPVRDPAQ